jgi:FkbM family methyltransferase
MMNKIIINNLDYKKLTTKVNQLKKLSKKIPIYIYGTGSFAIELKEAIINSGYKFKYFVNKPSFLKKSLVDPSLKMTLNNFLRIKEDAQLLVGIHNRDVGIESITKHFFPLKNIIIFTPQDFYGIFQNKLGWRYWLSSKKYLLEKNNFKKLQKTITLLSDDISKQRLIDIYLYRLGLKPSYSNFTDNEKQYFNKLSIGIRQKKIIYCDIGSYDGDSIIDAERYLKPDEIYAFEPVSSNFSRMLKKLSFLNTRFNLIPLGISKKFDKVPFSDTESQSESARIVESSNNYITTISLDESFNVDFNFIKIDVEGFEKDVLIGAKKTIIKNKPIITMSLYHNPYDLWELPLLIKKILPDYKLFVRQHQFNTFDCVLYCIPR